MGTPGSAWVTIETVPVGDPNNAPDTRYETRGYGRVKYTYSIGKFEITAVQYCEFLNAVAKTDTYALYNTNMDYDAKPGWQGPNIKRTGSSGSYEYSVDPNWANRPVTIVSWAMRRGSPTGFTTASRRVRRT